MIIKIHDDMQDILLTDQLREILLIAALVLAILTPVVFSVLAVRFSRIIKDMKKKQWSNHKIVEKRMEVYGRMAPKLNDLYCFYCYVGNWDRIMPEDILELKRDLDKDMDTYFSLFSDLLSKKYRGFMLLCFISASGWEHEMKIKSLYELRQQNCVNWDDKWIPYFDTNNVVEATRIKEAYFSLIESFKEELVVFQYGDYPEIAGPLQTNDQ